MSSLDITDEKESFDIAIIGMAGRFPGARNLDEFWRNLRDGVESISFFTHEQMESLGVDTAALNHPDFVKAGALLENIDMFDAAFFGFSPREAALIDPQHRVFMECAWEALEEAGYHPKNCESLVGVYAGASLSTYLLYNLMADPAAANPEESFQIMIGNDKDFVATRVSYKLNLKGPSLDVQTGCSTSLVAVHLACQGLLSYQCDMALAGGVSIQVPQRTGYYYQPSGVNSPDGHCRAFDAKAQGTVFGSGVGVVVLKRLADAISDGDFIHAVIKGSSINNDGSSKIGYTAPSVDGQAQVIALAQMVAGVDPETISYVEAHGTGTSLGDPVEVLALTKVFSAATSKKGFCALGSIKTNIGHLDAAAGVAGLIKTVLALKQKQLPPSLNFEEPNPKIDFANSPFYVNSKLSEWKTNGTPLRAGVSSFGIGGTNAHVIVEEAPDLESSTKSRPWQLLLFSAKTETALDQATTDLAEFLKRQSDSSLPDIAHTMQMSRTAFDCGRMLVCSDIQDAIKALESRDPQRVLTLYREQANNSIVFMFPGGGTQHTKMGHELYLEEPTFREQFDSCAELLERDLKLDLREVVYPTGEQQESTGQLAQTSIALPALFAIEYALAKLWMSWGVHPQAMIGHSLGEYVAACLAGVFSLEDALSLVALRSRLIENLPSGAMISIPLSEDELLPLLDDRLSVAAINASCQCVVSGPADAVQQMADTLATKGIEFRRLHINAAGHSRMVTPIMETFAESVSRFKLHPPRIPYVSNVTGTWITEEQATDPHYYARHLRSTVRFASGIEQLLKDTNRVLLEVGPGQALSTLARFQTNRNRTQLVVSSMRHPYDQQPDLAFLLATLGKLCLSGVPIEWHGFYMNERRRRVPLPSYPFERQRYWIEPKKAGASSSNHQRQGKKPDIADWFYIPSWKRTAKLKNYKAETPDKLQSNWLVFVNDQTLCLEVVKRLEQEGHNVITVTEHQSFAKVSDRRYTINPKSENDYDSLIAELKQVNQFPARIAHLWSLDDGARQGKESFHRAQDDGYYSLIFLAKALDKNGISDPIHLWLIANNVQEVEGKDVADAERATLLAVCKVIPQECQNISCHYIDVDLSESGALQTGIAASRVMAEMNLASDELIAYRGDQRWVQIYEPVRFEKGPDSVLRKNGVYLITGGLGGIGLLLAEHLARTVQAKLALIARAEFPDRWQWHQWLASHDERDEVSLKIRRIQAIEETGSEVVIASADVAVEGQMRRAVAGVLERFGSINGVIHAAGLAGEKTISFLPELTRSDCESQFRSKVHGVYVLDDVLRGLELDFCILFSSNTSILGGLGSLGYSAANIFMDAFASRRNKGNDSRWISANWDGWLLAQAKTLSSNFQTSMDQYAMSPQESVEAFTRVISQATSSQVIVSTGDLTARLDMWIKRVAQGLASGASDSEQPTLHPRPSLGTSYVAPTNEIENVIVKIWQELLGIEQLGIHDNFFDLGGNSLIGLKVISGLKRELNIEIPVVRLFEGPTVCALAKVLSSDQNQKPSYETSRSRGQRRRERMQQTEVATVAD